MGTSKVGDGSLSGGTLEKTDLADVLRSAYISRAERAGPRFRFGGRNEASGSSGAGSSRPRRTGKPSTSGSCSGRSGSPTRRSSSPRSRRPSRTRDGGSPTRYRTQGRSPRTSPTPVSAPWRRRSSIPRSSGARGRSPSSRSTAAPDVPSAFDQTTATLLLEALRRRPPVIGARPKVDPKARLVFSPDLLLRYQCAVVTPEEAEALDAIDGAKTAADVCLDLRILERLTSVGFVSTAARAPDPESLADSGGVASLNVEVAGAPPGARISEGLEQHARLVWNTYRRLDWIDAYELLGTTDGAQDADLRRAVHERARALPPGQRRPGDPRRRRGSARGSLLEGPRGRQGLRQLRVPAGVRPVPEPRDDVGAGDVRAADARDPAAGGEGKLPAGPDPRRDGGLLPGLRDASAGGGVRPRSARVLDAPREGPGVGTRSGCGRPRRRSAGCGPPSRRASRSGSPSRTPARRSGTRRSGSRP